MLRFVAVPLRARASQMAQTPKPRKRPGDLVNGRSRRHLTLFVAPCGRSRFLRKDAKARCRQQVIWRPPASTRRSQQLQTFGQQLS